MIGPFIRAHMLTWPLFLSFLDRTSAMEGCTYTHRSTTAPVGVVDCEHVFYHKCMAEKNQARIVSNRNM